MKLNDDLHWMILISNRLSIEQSLKWIAQSCTQISSTPYEAYSQTQKPPQPHHVSSQHPVTTAVKPCERQSRV